jgi:hypothetical protein
MEGCGALPVAGMDRANLSIKRKEQSLVPHEAFFFINKLSYKEVLYG